MNSLRVRASNEYWYSQVIQCPLSIHWLHSVPFLRAQLLPLRPAAVPITQRFCKLDMLLVHSSRKVWLKYNNARNNMKNTTSQNFYYTHDTYDLTGRRNEFYLVLKMHRSVYGLLAALTKRYNFRWILGWNIRKNFGKFQTKIDQTVFGKSSEIHNLTKYASHKDPRT